MKTTKRLQNIWRLLTYDRLYQQIPDDDVINKQRFILFRIFSFTGALVSAGAFIKMYLTFEIVGFYTLLIPCLSVILILNFYLVRKIQMLRTAYTVLLVNACLLLHIVAYTCGGIRTAGTFYFSVIIVYAFMLLGRKSGWIFTSAIILHIVYLYCISTYTDFTSFEMFQDKISLINEDFLTNAVLTFFLMAALSNYMQSRRNVLIQRIVKQRDEMQEKNIILEKKNAELDKFASVASHDLKAPLRAIGTITDLITEDHVDILNEEVTKNLSVIKGRVVRMENLINGLLAYSKIERTTNSFSEVCVRTLIEECLSRIQTAKEVELEMGEAMPLLFTDKKKLSSVFHHLIDNAIKFNNQPVIKIKINCEEEIEHWLFSVSDNGPGISKNYHEKIFVIFQTINARDEVESTGAGLAIVKKIVNDQGGNIRVQSEEGHGSTFLFTWKKNKNYSEKMQYVMQNISG